ncbi:MAG: T9SS type A sorting domain-containing protein [Paludibacter sp.]|nr:T9SS type A sorting domain-containing protein [Paludibacter sp.]
MKKITLLLYIITCVLVGQAQNNLLTDQNLGTWANGASGSLYVVSTSGTDSFAFQDATIKKDVVYWDKKFLGEKATSISPVNGNSFKAYVVGKQLNVKNANTSTVEIYSALGAKVQTLQLVNGVADMSDFTKGLYIVRVGKQATKIILKN